VEKAESTKKSKGKSAQAAVPAPSSTSQSQSNSVPSVEEEEEPHFHLPEGLHDLIDSFNIKLSQPSHPLSEPDLRMLVSSHITAPQLNSEAPRGFRPKNPFPTPNYYPQQPLHVFDDPKMYQRVDPDTLFYAFYYQQGTYQQYLAAKALKEQSWRFHKQYQTWFQRHEEPNFITDDYEQGTYRFFDYESTWYVYGYLLETSIAY